MKNSIFIHIQIIKRMIRYFNDTKKLNKRFEFFESHDKTSFEYINFAYDDDEFIRQFHFEYVFLL